MLNEEQMEIRRAPTAGPKYPKAGESIQFRDGDRWQHAQVIGRGGKASSRVNRDYYNVKIDEVPVE